MAAPEPTIAVAELTEESLKDDPHQPPSDGIRYNWKEVTQDFYAACNELVLGELLHDSDFGLFEAMSAIEMMDPKMDAGMSPVAKDRILNIEDGVRTKTLKIESFTWTETIQIIDASFACLVTWLEGHSLAQTVFTNLYLHNPYLIEDPTMKAFSICFLKMVDLIRDRVNRASVFEEEDFQPMCYGFKFAGDVTDVRAMGMVKEVEEELNRTVKMTRAKQGESRDTETEKEHEFALALHSRLKFCRIFFAALVALNKEKCLGATDALRLLSSLTEHLQVMTKSATLAMSPGDKKIDQEYPTVMGFEPLANQRLLPPTFPRYTKIKTAVETMNYLTKVVDELKMVCTVVECTSVHNALDFFKEFSKTLPSILSRSLLQLSYLSQSRRVLGKELIVDALRETIRTFICPPVLTQRCSLASNPQAKDYTDAFLFHAVRPMCSLFQITGHNRARQRESWARILEDLSGLQEEADKVDAFLHSALIKNEPSRQHLACFGTWVLYHLLQAMIDFVISGFELELYAVHEYHYIFWYLYECLYAWLVSALTRADSILHDQEMYLEQQKNVKSSKKNKKKRKARPHGKEITQSQALQQLCGGYFKAMLAFRRDGKLPKQEFEFDSEEVRYNHRFAPFGNVVTPPPVQYAYFKEGTDFSLLRVAPRAEDMYMAACKCFHQAKILLETINNPNDEVDNLIKVAKMNFIVVKLLAGGHQKDSKIQPEFDFSVHKNFPIIKIT